MQKIIDTIVGFWNYLDPKLKYTVLSGAVAWAVTKYAIELDATQSALIAGFVASLSGYKAQNDATLLREGILDDGNPDRPPGVENPDVGVKTPRKKAA